MSDAKPAGETTTTKLNDGGPAFPTQEFRETAAQGMLVDVIPGMSLRDWFAGQALAGICAADDWQGANDAAESAYKRADAMLTAREGGAA